MNDLPSSEELVALIDHLAVAVLVHHNGEFRYINRTAENILGYTAQEIGSMQFADFIHPDSLPLVQERATARMRGEPALPRYEIQVVTKQGNVRWVEITNDVITFMGERSIVITAFDITERKQIEMQHRQNEAWARQMLLVLFDAVIVFEKGRVIQANQPALNTFGYPVEEFIGLPALDLASPESVSIARHHIETNSEEMYEANLIRKDRSTFPAEIRGKMVFDGDRKLRVVSARDITDRKKTEAERDALREQIIEAQRAALSELSAPLLSIANHTVLMPLVGTIDTQRAGQIIETLLDGVAHHRATVAILDITGVKVVDTQVADALIRAARAVRLLGAQVILTGIGPSMAQTLVHLGANLKDIVTYGSLQSAVIQTLKG
jgi:rsbT co-antagonist protein RsbR